jgi:hypothetical protein
MNPVARAAVPLSTPSENPRWRPSRSTSHVCGLVHRPFGGSVDESARRLSHQEFAVAGMLGREGHVVRSLAEGRGPGRVADLEICDTPVEVKSWLQLTERHGMPPSPRSVLNKLLDARGQAPTVVLNGRGSGLSMRTARRGMALYAARPDGALLSTVRVLGDGFDLAWTCRSEMGLRSQRPSGLEAVARPSQDVPQIGRGIGLGS